MGWANCGTDNCGRPIGYAHPATCDFPGCMAAIHRGLAYACGGMHGEADGSCERYFCPDHLVFACFDCGPKTGQVCQACASAIEAECRCEDGNTLQPAGVSFRVVAIDTGVIAAQFGTLDACDKFTWTDQVHQAMSFDTPSDADGFAQHWIGAAGWKVEAVC